jgi:hypothetical protein
MQTMMAPSPQGLQPSNQTQAQASTATQVTLTVATALIPIGGAGAPAAAESTAASSFVFYSGEGAQAAAQTWSAANNGTMIGMTQFGQAIENLTMTPEAASEAFGGWPTPPRGTGFHQSAIEARGVPNLFCGLCRKGSGFDLHP